MTSRLTPQPPTADPVRPRVGISACLLGDEVRYDGGHKREAFLSDTLAPYVDYVRVCPEVEVGMGTPREPLRLVRDTAGGVRMLTTRTSVDHTVPMRDWADQRLGRLAADDLAGYVLKKKSPSCGLDAVPVFDANGGSSRVGRGLFAAALRTRFPLLPIVEEPSLDDPHGREHFVEQVFAHARLLRLFGSPWTVGSLVAFHTAHKLLLLSHSTTRYRELGRLVAAAAGQPVDALRHAYTRGFAETLAIRATAERHVNVLQHMAGHLKTAASVEDRRALADAIERHRLGQAPLDEPVRLLYGLASTGGVRYLLEQVYFDPYPRALGLRRHLWRV